MNDKYRYEPTVNRLLSLRARILGEIMALEDRQQQEIASIQNKKNAVLLTLQIYCEDQGVEMPTLDLAARQ